VRFASVYRAFRDVAEFMSELEELVRKGPGPATAPAPAPAQDAVPAAPPRAKEEP
jgi:hypothetical protein